MSDPATILTLLHALWGSIGQLTITIIVTTFLMLLLKEFAMDLFYYFSTKMSDIGKGALILWWGRKMMVQKVHFRKIEVFDDELIIYIPIRMWMRSPKMFIKADGESFE